MADIKGTDGALRELALFAGAGGGILGGKLLGWQTVCAVEWEPYPASVLAQRQNDGLLPPFPIWDDVRTFDGRPWRGLVDVVSGGFPCQDISVAGKGDGLDGERSGLWSEMARIIGEVRPRYAFVENSPALTTRGLGRVLGDLASMGYDARWGVISAADACAPHLRERVWIVAYPDGTRPQGGIFGRKPSQQIPMDAARRREAVPDSESPRLAACEMGPWKEQPWGSYLRGERGWIAEPDVGRVADGVAARVDRLKALGNGQVPQAAALAWRVLTA